VISLSVHASMAVCATRTAALGLSAFSRPLAECRSASNSGLIRTMGALTPSVASAALGIWVGRLASRLCRLLQCLPRGTLDRVPRRPFPSGTRRTRRRMFHPRRIEGRPPALLVVPRELKVVALPGHPDGDVADTGPGVEPGSDRVQRAVVRGVSSTRRSRALRPTRASGPTTDAHGGFGATQS
jgi:hypothetical protein